MVASSRSGRAALDTATRFLTTPLRRTFQLNAKNNNENGINKESRKTVNQRIFHGESGITVCELFQRETVFARDDC